ncbi:MAG: PliI family lysozyme inhibitor of I-type lysozyme, partial [Proteobacteria bacterium]|nr:PliI family lysozyme inhibitor of I-type lysozyme [Pseudomonadota bacterium]
MLIPYCPDFKKAAMQELWRISVFVYISFLVSMMIVETCHAQIEPGMIMDKLKADLDGDDRPELIVLRRAVPPATFERVEIFTGNKNGDPAFTSQWQEVVETEVLPMFARGKIELQKAGELTLAKYSWRKYGEGRGGGYEYEHVIYYGYVGGKFGQVFDYVAEDSEWVREEGANQGSTTELDATIRFEDKDRIPDIDLLVTETTE